jgi:hypothetical protein
VWSESAAAAAAAEPAVRARLSLSLSPAPAASTDAAMHRCVRPVGAIGPGRASAAGAGTALGRAQTRGWSLHGHKGEEGSFGWSCRARPPAATTNARGAQRVVTMRRTTAIDHHKGALPQPLTLAGPGVRKKKRRRRRATEEPQGAFNARRALLRPTSQALFDAEAVLVGSTGSLGQERAATGWGLAAFGGVLGLVVGGFALSFQNAGGKRALSGAVRDASMMLRGRLRPAKCEKTKLIARRWSAGAIGALVRRVRRRRARGRERRARGAMAPRVFFKGALSRRTETHTHTHQPPNTTTTSQSASDHATA